MRMLTVAACLVALAGGSVVSGGNAMTLAQLRQARRQAAHRTRRIIFNNDGNEPVYYLDEATPEALLACRTTPLLGSQVDSLFYCTWSSGFSMFTHDTKIGQVFTTTANPKHPQNTRGGFSRNKTAEFIRQGKDVLQIMVEFARQHDLEIVWSFRMNDVHDAWGGWYSDSLFPQLKREHPEWLVGSRDRRPRHGGWTAMDFNHQAVRDLAVAFIEEVCQTYDVDGVEMDFFRHPVYLKGPAWGKDATADELAKMTRMIRRVREVTEREGLRRGRPILVAVRVPDSAVYCKAMGLDLERWLADGLIDLMAVSGYFRLSPWQTSVELGHKHGVPVYPCLSETRLRDAEARKVRASLACYRGRAMNAWAAGADGVYLFNAFNPRSPLWRQLGDPGTLAALERVYTTGARGVAVIDRWMANGERRFLGRQVVSPERPVALKPGEATTVELPVGEALGQAKAEVTLRLRVKGLPDAADLAVKLHGEPLGKAAPSAPYLDYGVKPALVRKGINRFDIALRPDSTAKPILQDLLLWVRPGEAR